MKLSTKFKIATNTIPVVSVIIAMSLADLNFILKSEYVLTNRQTKQIKSEIKRKRGKVIV